MAATLLELVSTQGRDFGGKRPLEVESDEEKQPRPFPADLAGAASAQRRRRPAAAAKDVGALAFGTPLKLAACPGAAVGGAEVSVGDLVRRHSTVVLSSCTTLSDAADLIILKDRTAVAIVDDAGALLGTLTEEDVLRAYAREISPASTVAEWLRSQSGRSPTELLSSWMVRPDASLHEAAALLREQSDSDTDSRHLVVRDGAGPLCGILSALDLARALCDNCLGPEASRRLGQSTAAELLKPRRALPICSASAPMSRALEQMSSMRQNCALVVNDAVMFECGDGAGLGPWDLCGILTPRDALRAFVEHTPTSVEVGHWLRGVRAGAWAPRAVRSDEPVRTCASRMAFASIHHLVVLSPSGTELCGVLSSTDLARALGSAERVVEGCGPRDEGDMDLVPAPAQEEDDEGDDEVM